MEIKLIKLELENFKGVRKFVFSPEGKNATVHGDNGTGKTTLADAFRYLLFGKDTQDRADFQIKTVDETGAEIPGLDHTVRAVIDIDGKPVELKKTYSEKWTKRRGEANKALTGHTTDHFVNGVPIQKKEWDDKMKALVDEDAFKLVTLPSYFNNLPADTKRKMAGWQVRRDILLQVCGDVADLDVINNNPDLISLPDILGDRTRDEHKKVVKAKQGGINERLKELPARIDELLKSLPTEAKNRQAIEAYIKHIDSKIEKAQDDSELSALRKELAEKETALVEANLEHSKSVREASQGIEKEIYAIEDSISKINRERAELQADIRSAEKTVARNDDILVMLRAEYTKIAAQEHQYSEICPTCNQPLPQDQIDAVRLSWKQGQAEKLTAINDEGKEIKAATDKLKADAAENEKKLMSLEKSVEAHEKALKDMKDKAPIILPPKEVGLLMMEIEGMKESIQTRPTTDVSGLQAERREEQAKLAALDAAEGTKKRITELGAEEKKLAAEFEELERQIFLMEKFIVSKVEMLESRINGKFRIARFKLFNVLVNGAVEECCITTLKGATDMSFGESTWVGCDIIRTLQEHYGIKAPVWHDEAGVCFFDLGLECQVIRLVANDDFPEMQVDYGTVSNS